MAEKHKEVLVVFRDRRRPIFFECSSDPQVEYQHILDAVKETFDDVLSSGEGSSENTEGYYLQTDNKVWGVSVGCKCKGENTITLYSTHSIAVDSSVPRCHDK